MVYCRLRVTPNLRPKLPAAASVITVTLLARQHGSQETVCLTASEERELELGVQNYILFI